MAQDQALARRGLFLLIFMLGLMALVGFILFRRETQPNAEQALAPQSDLVALSVPNTLATFPGQVNWASLYKLGEVLPSAPGWEIRYNATIALARLGSKKLPLANMREMLDEKRQMRNFHVRLDNGQEVPDEAAARRTVLNALQALLEWHKNKEAVKIATEDQSGELSRVYAAVRQLTGSSNATLREEAEKTKKELGI